MSLLPISVIIANAALNLGGSYIKWERASYCPNIRDNGKPCYDSMSGSSWNECNVCKGRGVIYLKGVIVKGIYTDNSHHFEPDGSGGFIQGERTLSLPLQLKIQLLKPKKGFSSDGSSTGRRLMRDKFTLLDARGRPIEVLYLKDNPQKPTISSGTIYQICPVETNFQ